MILPAALSTISDPELLGELFSAARDVKDTIYGRRLVIFAPLYVSNFCTNHCTYCAFRYPHSMHRVHLDRGEVLRASSGHRKHGLASCATAYKVRL